MLSLLLWLALGALYPRLPRRLTVFLGLLALLYGLGLTGRLYASTPHDHSGGTLYYLLVQLSGALAGVSLMRWPHRPQAAILWGYLTAVYPVASGNSLAGSSHGVVPLLAALLLTVLSPPAILLGVAGIAALQAFIEHQAVVGLLIPPPVLLTLDPLDRALPAPNLLQFLGGCLLLLPAVREELGWRWGPLLWTAAILTPYPLPWLLLAAALSLARSRYATAALLALGLCLSGGPWLYVLKGGSIREYQLARLQAGQVLTAQELAGMLPPDKLQSGRVKYPKFATLPTVEKEAPTPDWLMVSNNPENVDPQGQCANLYRGTLPAGTGRLFISHFNIRPLQPAEMCLTFRNRGTAPATLTWGRKVWFAKQSPIVGDELWRDYLAATPSNTNATIPPGQIHQESLHDMVGNGACMADVTLDQPLELTVSMLTPKTPRNVDGGVWGMVFRQSRGLYLKPDRVLTARYELGESVACEPLPKHLSGLDGTRLDELKGNYGAVETLDFELLPDPQKRFKRALILLVPRAGYLAAVLEGKLYAISPYGALVLANLAVDRPTRWSWVYSLPANSFAPNGILIVPLR